ncbi:hypothetical protein HDU93_003481 [Gonapodya sp. JEL0774]|nr:hypothetical protein HDU93_003481 [Gonapodya sp. JEL0774]
MKLDSVDKLALSNPVVDFLFPAASPGTRNSLFAWISTAQWILSIALALYAAYGLTRMVARSYWNSMRILIRIIFVTLAVVGIVVISSRGIRTVLFGQSIRDFSEEEVELLL